MLVSGTTQEKRKSREAQPITWLTLSVSSSLYTFLPQHTTRDTHPQKVFLHNHTVLRGGTPHLQANASLFSHTYIVTKLKPPPSRRCEAEVVERTPPWSLWRRLTQPYQIIQKSWYEANNAAATSPVEFDYQPTNPCTTSCSPQQQIDSPC